MALKWCYTCSQEYAPQSEHGGVRLDGAARAAARHSKGLQTLAIPGVLPLRSFVLPRCVWPTGSQTVATPKVVALRRFIPTPCFWSIGRPEPTDPDPHHKKRLVEVCPDQVLWESRCYEHIPYMDTQDETLPLGRVSKRTSSKTARAHVYDATKMTVLGRSPFEIVHRSVARRWHSLCSLQKLVKNSSEGLCYLAYYTECSIPGTVYQI